MTPQRMREILADHLAKLDKIPAHLIQEIRDGTSGEHIGAALDAIAYAVIEAEAALHEAKAVIENAVKEAATETARAVAEAKERRL